MKERGFSLVEVLFTLATLALIGLGVASGVAAGHKASRTFESDVAVRTQAAELRERLMTIAFGSAAEDAATAGELTELFDDDDVFGGVTLHRVKNFGAVQFELDGFPVPGAWRIVIDNDLDGDGAIDEDAEEGRDDLLRITVAHDGRTVADIIRFDTTATP